MQKVYYRLMLYLNAGKRMIMKAIYVNHLNIYHLEKMSIMK